jgi:hypothetical protein
MKRAQIDKLMTFILGFSLFIMATGAYISINHYSSGKPILYAGALLYLLLSNFEIQRLRRIIKGNP